MYVTDYTSNHVKVENINSTTMTQNMKKYLLSAGNLTAPYDLSFDPTGLIRSVVQRTWRYQHHVGRNQFSMD